MSVLKLKDNEGNWISIPAGGVGVPSGGTAGQFLIKSSDEDYTTGWETFEEEKPSILNLTLLLANWVADSSLEDVYHQQVSIPNGTNKTKVDLQADASTILQLISDGVSALYIENDNAVFKAYAIGASPTANLTVQGTCVETE